LAALDTNAHGFHLPVLLAATAPIVRVAVKLYGSRIRNSGLLRQTLFSAEQASLTAWPSMITVWPKSPMPSPLLRARELAQRVRTVEVDDLYKQLEATLTSNYQNNLWQKQKAFELFDLTDLGECQPFSSFGSDVGSLATCRHAQPALPCSLFVLSPCQHAGLVGGTQ
jgi:hypothetical protein